MIPVRQVLGDQPFAEISEPRAVAVGEEHGLIAIGGHRGWLHWAGAGTASQDWLPHAVCLYDQATHRFRSLLTTRWPVRSLDFHPRQPLLAIGTGSYDGGWSFHGELLLLHLDTGEVVSALADSREVRAVKWRTWRHGRVLDLALAPHSEAEYGNDAMKIGFDAMVVREDWLAVRDGEIAEPELDGPLRDSDIVTADQARAAVEALSPTWSHRGPVRAVEQLRDGRIVATMDGVRLESRLPSGEVDWSVAEDGGRQLFVAPDQESVLVAATVTGRKPWYETDIHVGRYSLRDGKLLSALDPGFPGAVVGRTDGSFALRSVDHVAEPAAFFSPRGDEIGRVDLKGFSPFHHAFPIRYASALYFLRSELPTPRVNLDIDAVAVGDDLIVRHLFPLDSQSAGPGVEVGDSLVYSTSRPDSCLVRRRLSDGAALWRLPLARPVTAIELDAGGSVLYVALNSGELLAVSADTGTVLWRQDLRVGDAPTVGTSLASARPGRLLIGTIDGRILDVDVSASNTRAAT
ncbi:PQQ-binding-like beta-propeller repeat protein [Kutzneria buriramensis]|uniref:Outer membrane protein assembly factor BamB n=1 Tax=Kutzneria buriramensis TaxID=1045776 RepID=A0A3E0GXQ9_9PSEU|nr:PQQ-binding-like beta-propeller repeat protein [Kutzneria buriramensis]REH32988.1 outer membrane protein assembly factor BamB [Kutzneria buriramensis]